MNGHLVGGWMSTWVHRWMGTRCGLAHEQASGYTLGEDRHVCEWFKRDVVWSGWEEGQVDGCVLSEVRRVWLDVTNACVVIWVDVT